MMSGLSIRRVILTLWRVFLFVIKAGSTTALVGTNGSGKSTIIKLLLGLYQPTRGRILWDGVDILTLDTASLRSNISVVYQDFGRYELSARDNVKIGDISNSTALGAVESATRDAGISDVLRNLPAGLDTMLSTGRRSNAGNGGSTLSGGQWQRLALARSLFRRGVSLLILDEPNSTLDPIAESDVHDAVIRHQGSRAALLISHRLSTIRYADEILVVADGRVNNRGTHNDLMLADGLYKEMFDKQAKGYTDDLK